MNDRDQARTELADDLVDGMVVVRPSARAAVDAVLAHPDLVLRALGMRVVERPRQWVGNGCRVWVEPPTDQEPDSDSGAET